MALIIDVETTGLPKKQKNSLFGKLPAYENLEVFDSARIVQVSIMLCNEFFEEIEFIDFIVKTDGYSISNSQFHGITDEISAKEGIPFVQIAEVLLKMLKKVSHIVAHNAIFDMSILKSELFRLGLYSIIDELDTKQILCTMKHTKHIVKALNKIGYIKYPSLAELYRFVFDKNIENAHNSKYDVINLHDIVKSMYDSKQLNFYENMIFNIQIITNENIIM
jgi:DNA polymerase III epsilon subunit-like protein